MIDKAGFKAFILLMVALIDGIVYFSIVLKFVKQIMASTHTGSAFARLIEGWMTGPASCAERKAACRAHAMKHVRRGRLPRGTTRLPAPCRRKSEPGRKLILKIRRGPRRRWY